jgi:hypothetical protein
MTIEDIGPQYSDVERAYSKFADQARADVCDPNTTSKQLMDLVIALDELPITSWRLFKAGWDAAGSRK